MENLKELVSQNKILELSKKLLAYSLDNELENELINLTSRQNKLNKEIRKNIISYEDSNREKNKINNAFLAIIDELKSFNFSKQSTEIAFPVPMERYQKDLRISATLNRIREKQINLQNRYLPIDVLVKELYTLFDRLTFIGEPKIETCRTQRWSARVHTSKMTYEFLVGFQGNIYQTGNEEQINIYSNLLNNVSKYIDSLVAYLFEESKVDMEELYDLIGTDGFVNKFKENIEIKFPNNSEDETIIMEERIKKIINKYLDNTISNIRDLVKYTK